VFAPFGFQSPVFPKVNNPILEVTKQITMVDGGDVKSGRETEKTGNFDKEPRI
jgi:hypothetical protein